MRIFREIAKWRRWRHAPWLMATAVITNSCHRFSKRWHVADIKNFAGDDQTTLMVHRYSANIACIFRIYVCLRLCYRDCCFAADGSGSCRRQKLHWRWPGNPNGRSKFRNLGMFTFTWLQLTRRLRDWRWLPDIAQTARCRRQKHRRRWPGSIEIPQIRKFTPTRSSKELKNFFFFIIII